MTRAELIDWLANLLYFNSPSSKKQARAVAELIVERMEHKALLMPLKTLGELILGDPRG